MEPGGTYERRVGITDGRRTGESFMPQSVDGIVVAAVVFEDYTFEGDAESAARKAMLDEGTRLQLPRLMRLVYVAHRARDVRSAEGVRRFRAALSALDDVAPQSSADKVLAAYPGLTPAMANNLKVGIEVSMHHVRTELLGDLERFEQRLQAAPADNSFKSWLAGQQARFEGWLARL
jgi:hypothetical protein